MDRDYPDNFADYLETVGSKRADADGGNAAKWTPRDAVIDCLRRIDRGELKPDALVICWRIKEDDGATSTSFSNAGPDIHTSLGLLAFVQNRMLADAHENAS